eukprot:m.282245 g.282245  ORF g.282245 m.282245 type:complete len:95 (+) comp40652_c1_seq25:52-336(+)
MPAEARASLPSSYDHLRLLGCQTGTNSTRTEPKVAATHVIKYAYTANSESPLEAVELTVSAGDRVEFLQSHPDNTHKENFVKTEGGRAGYVPFA